MKLRVYLATHNIRKKDFAYQIGITPVTFSRALSGQVSQKTAAKIEQITKGEVKAIEVCPDFYTRKFKPRGNYLRKKNNDRIRNKR